MKCPMCKSPLSQPATGRRKLFCSTDCRVKAHRLKRKIKWITGADLQHRKPAGGGDVLASTAATGKKE